MLCGIATQAVSDIITNLLYSNAKTTWKQVFSRRSSYYEYAAAALSAIVPGSSRSRMVARAGMNALASSFSSFCKHKRQLTIHNVGKYVLGFLTAFGISFLCELLGKGVDLQIRSLNKTKYAKFKGAPLLRKHVNNIRAMVVVIKSHMKSQLRNNKQMLVGWGTALTQALHRKYGYNY